VGACLALDLLGVDMLVCSPLNLGSGTVTTEHGLLPVPAPPPRRWFSVSLFMRAAPRWN